MSITVRNAHKYYNKSRQNELHVLGGISLELPETGMVAVFGRSGCGKTTLLNAIGGLDKLDSGEIALFGESLSRNTDTVRNRYVGYIFQNYNLDPMLTVYENVALSLRILGMKDEDVIFERVIAALSNVGMDNFKFRTPDTLSGGQQQRVAIARAIVKTPKIILADEPTGNLDEENTISVMEILKEISKTALVLLVTHEKKLVDLYCDRVIELSDGVIASERENAKTDGYRARNRNDIYLGELSKTELGDGKVTLECYGELSSPVTLRLVAHEGKLFLDCGATNGISILDSTSEVNLREGVYSEDEKADTSASIDTSRLPPFEGQAYGRLFSFRRSFTDALKQNLGKKKRKGKGLLQTAMALLAVVLVFVVASVGSPLRDLFDVRENHTDRLFYIPVDPSINYSDVSLSVGRNGIGSVSVVRNRPEYDRELFSFRIGNFMSADAINLRAEGHVLSDDLSSSLPLLAGKRSDETETYCLITSALADDFIESSTYKYVSEYKDLIGCISSESFLGSSYIRIVGVVESDEKNMYLSSLTCAEYRLMNLLYESSMKPLSLSSYEGKINSGSVVYRFRDGYPEITVGEKINVLGHIFTVSEVIDERFNGDEYEKYNKKWYSSAAHERLIFCDEDYFTLSRSVGESDERLYFPQFSYHVYSNGDIYYDGYMKVYASDPAAAEEFLSRMHSDLLMTPDSFYETKLDKIRANVIEAAITVAVVLLLMCLCSFFIMRSNFMSRVREVGILRAVGVAKRNIIFRFAVEGAVLTTVTLLPAYLITSAFVSSLSSATLTSSSFFYPLWLSVGTLTVIYLATVLFGVLPAATLLRKTPSEILAKYDI